EVANHGAAPPDPQRRARRAPALAADRGAVRLDANGRGARRRDALVGARKRQRLSRHDLRISGRRGGPPPHRQDARKVPPRRGDRTARRRLPHRPRAIGRCSRRRDGAPERRGGCRGISIQRLRPAVPLRPNLRTFGHGGWGGSLGFADLDARVSWAYIMNKMSLGTTGDTRAAGILAALYGSL